MAIEIDWGGQAFPTEGGADSGLYPDPGMSLRDWFAGQALAGIMSDGQTTNGTTWQAIAHEAYAAADAMIALRKAGSE